MQKNMITSLVAQLHHASDEAATSIRRICEHSACEVGERVEDRLPIIVEADNPAGLESVHRWIRNLSGVVHTDVVFVFLG